MDAVLLEKLANLVEGLAADRAVRAAVIAADGPAFSAGLNLKTTPGLDRLGQRRLVDALNDCFGTLYAWPKPLVAAVTATPSPVFLALCADWRIVADVPAWLSACRRDLSVAAWKSRALNCTVGGAPPDLLGETVGAVAAEALAIMDERAADVRWRAIAQAERHACRRRKPLQPSSASCARRARAHGEDARPGSEASRPARRGCGAPPPPCCGFVGGAARAAWRLQGTFSGYRDVGEAR
jgi:enoyl-CoA hydratase